MRRKFPCWLLAVLLVALARSSRGDTLYFQPTISDSVVCPDHQQTCPDHSTCCLLQTGQYGCCPYDQGVCCSDHLHCCPYGTKCDVAHQRCVKATDNTPIAWFNIREKKVEDAPQTDFVLCPDRKSTCADGSTCCPLLSGGYGCCPMPKAVCCQDKLHCCPHRTRCNEQKQTCDSPSGTSVPWMKKLNSYPTFGLPLAAGLTTKCLGGSRACSHGHSCCRDEGNQWACCPTFKAVCCSDGKHCCPQGHQCDPLMGQCIPTRTPLQAPQYKDSPVDARPTPQADVKVVCPGGKTQCPKGMTCCKTGVGRYGCCPYADATCCADGKHCCPRDYKCDVAHSMCRKSGFDVPVVNLIITEPGQQAFPSVQLLVGPPPAVKCKDGSRCPASSTCCMLPTKTYGCCPQPKASCCPDGVHCCPHGYNCTTSNYKCTKADGSSVPMLKKVAAHYPQTVVCPDMVSTCPDGSTCCLMADGHYGCCPLPEAVCCKDKIHCCPQGYTCNDETGHCQKGTLHLPWSSKFPAQAPDGAVERVLCPDGKSTCFNNQTCCLLASGKYGCCPFPKATCCSDHIHCCPHGYKCDVKQRMCTKQEDIVPLAKKVPAQPTQPGIVVCPDHQSQCPDGQTCCLIASGQYGCCPLPKAVCCADKIHCCPSGTTCDPETGECKGAVTVPWSIKQPALSSTLVGVVCPGGQGTCPQGQTCCKLASGKYGCCPYPEAACCSDHIHCCPHGYKCDVKRRMCTKQEDIVPLAKKVPAQPTQPGIVVCPDHQSQCPDGQTCCLMASGQYGCCPLPKAVCCADKIHCCPSGTTCDPETGECKGAVTVPWSIKQPALGSTLVGVVCPGGQGTCPQGQTCCKLASGKYGCCPYPEAVCCSDRRSCCPHGYTCDVPTRSCRRQHTDSTIGWFSILPSEAVEASQIKCSDHKSECPAGYTCCHMVTGEYGCCPLPQAVCCADHIHCCPSGSTCEPETGTCKQGSVRVPWRSKQPARVRNDDVPCPGGQVACMSGQTCCMLTSGKYGCCPYAQATCCEDHLHCCPNGYKCDVASATCVRQGTSMVRAVELSEPATRREEKTVPCPGGQQSCQSGQTCCLLQSGHYGCCPYPDAVCCSDKEHCCPHGFQCDLTRQFCARQQDTEPVPWSSKLEATPVQGVGTICPGGKSECPPLYTCCHLQSGQWGCCPYEKAVCCSDHMHCCPHGTTCDVTTSSCRHTESSLTISWSSMAHLHAQPKNTVCPDQRTTCPGTDTCCKAKPEGYGCCPLPQAVCCSDGQHCCPAGFQCNSQTGRCDSGDGKSVDMVPKRPGQPHELHLPVICPDKRSQCAHGQTCCLLPNKKYGCCPMAKAVCCDDNIHCCPSDFKCDSKTQMCVKDSMSIGMTLHSRFRAKPTPKQHLCANSSVTCPDEYTCCPGEKTAHCCPLMDAVCCSDMEHCCPRETTCDTAMGRCLSTHTHTIPWSEKTTAQSIPAQSQTDKTVRVKESVPLGKTIPAAKYGQNDIGAIMCPDHVHECPDYSTCCQLRQGGWGCCPYPRANCCNDGEHCCPHGMWCDLRHQCCRRKVYHKDSVEALAAVNRVLWEIFGVK